MYQLNDFESRELLDQALADNISQILQSAINSKGKASIAVSGGSTPKGFFKALSNKSIDWKKVTITLADERWVDINSEDSNTRLVHENLLQNNAKAATFFHLKQGDALSEETLATLNVAAKNDLLPLDVSVSMSSHRLSLSAVNVHAAEVAVGISNTQKSPSSNVRNDPVTTVSSLSSVASIGVNT